MTDKQVGNNFSISDDSNESNRNNFTVNVAKDSPDISRKVLSQDIRSKVNQKGGLRMWETDPLTLRDYSNNLLVQSFVDTLSKSVSSVDWTIVNVDDEETKQEIKDWIIQGHPQKTWSEVVESTVRDLLIFGNAFLVIHEYENKDEPAEIVTPDASTMFIKTDDHGYINGYAQKTSRNSVTEIDAENVIHFQWASDNHRYYSQSPVEMSMDEIDIIDELKLKEILDLSEGGVSAVISQTESHDTDPMSSREWDQLTNQLEQSEGARHKSVYTKGSFERTEIGTSYDDLQIIDRYKFHLTGISSAFKVNPSYVGFDFENTNRATDESQRQAYKQRGVSVVLEQLEQKINKDLMPRLDDNAKFSWDIETEDDINKMVFYEHLAEAANNLLEAGIEFEVSDGDITVEDDQQLTPDQAIRAREMEVESQINDVDGEKLVSNIKDNLYPTEKLANKVADDGQIVSQKEIDGETWFAVESEDDIVLSLTDDEIKMTDKKEEFVDAMDLSDSFTGTIKKLEKEYNSRTNIIDEIQNKMDSFSTATYYEWISLCIDEDKSKL